MKILERILVIVIVMALIMKFSLTPGGEIITLCVTLILACMYYQFGFLFFNHIRLRHIFKKAAYKNVTAPKIIFAIVTGLSLSTIVVGSLFKVLNFSGANEMLLSGLVFVAIVLIISLILLIKNKDTNSKFILWRVCITGVVGTFLILTPDLSIVKFQYRNHPDYIEAYINYWSDPRNDELHKKMELERKRAILTDEEFKKYEESINNKGRD